jgi:hypothetical protein
MIMKGGNILPLAVTVAATVTHFVSVVDARTWIVFVPTASKVVRE